MTKQWFQVKEKVAGSKRLLLTWYIYKCFGKYPVYLIATVTAFFAYIFAVEERKNLKIYLNTLSKYTDKNCYQFSFTNGFRIFRNFAYSLVDKMLVFSGNFNSNNLIFSDFETEEKVMKYVRAKKGMFFITTHVGNAEIIRALLFSKKYEVTPKVNIFLEANQCKIFNDFIKNISIKNAGVETYAVEDIDVGTSIQIQDKLSNGEIVFMAGDRVSKQNQSKVYAVDFLGRQINLPIGVFKFAYLMNSPIFFIVAKKEDNIYKLYAKEFISKFSIKSENLKDLKNEYGKFLEQYTINAPYQFYNFFSIFKT